jgi:hypothetical protein
MSHHISNNTETTASQNGVDLTAAKADIVAIKAKTDQITITNPANISTMESGIATNVSGINGILNHSIDSNLKAFVDANSNKVGITTTQANNITTNNSKVGITTAQANNITTNNSKVGITTAQANNITTNNAKITYPSSASTKLALVGITSSVNLNSLVSQSNANVSAIAANTNAYPQFTNLKRLYNQGGDIYNDGKIKFAWNATSRQLQFYVLDIPSGEYLVGGVEKWEGTSRTSVATYLSQGESTAYKYFTSPQTSASSSVVNTTFNLTTSYARVMYFLHPYNELNYPSYEITILIGSTLGYHQISIKKFSN